MLDLVTTLESKFIIFGNSMQIYKLLKMIALIIGLCHVVGTCYHSLA